MIGELALALAAASGAGGLQAMSLTVRNDGPAPIACGAAVAHWLSLDLGRADPGHEIRVVLWRDTGSGAVYAVNAKRDRLPIERLWCGIEGRSWETRAELPFADPALPEVVGCAPAGERLRCR
jgi:hypothetical protein